MKTKNNGTDDNAEDLEKISLIEECLSEIDLISGFSETTEITNKVYVMNSIDSVLSDKLVDDVSSRVLLRKEAWDKIANISGSQLDCNRKSGFIVARG